MSCGGAGVGCGLVLNACAMRCFLQSGYRLSGISEILVFCCGNLVSGLVTLSTR